MSTTEVLAAQHAEVKAEIARTDTKAAMLLALIGGILAGAWTLAHDLPMIPAAYVVGEIGLAVVAVAAGLLLRSVRPMLGRNGFPLWATLTPQQLTVAAENRDLAADIVGLSRLAVTKFTVVRQAIDLLYAGAALLVLSALIALGGSL
ncbi:Pycsar system effector family protein [Streptomyces rubradiris]|uniref:Pycsar system effector family protein n=1 Tax=Streptomyces rubradiris TaxID=285531 RepID=UPI0033D08D3D